MTDPRANLRRILSLVVNDPGITAMMDGKARPRRDRREPDLQRKLKLEYQMELAFYRHFKKQQEQIVNRLTLLTGRQVKETPINVDDILDAEDDDFLAEIIRLVQAGITGGVGIISESISIGVDWTMTNNRAAEWAKKYAGQLIKDITDTTRKVVRGAVGRFVETPGMTMGDLINQLPFSRKRAETIAVTEVTRSYAEGQKLAGEEMRKKYPDVPIKKTWFTNNDDRVCPICAPLDGVTVGIDEEFAPGIDTPPGHVGCRCWIDYSTDILNA